MTLDTKPLWFEEYEKRIDEKFNSVGEKIDIFSNRCNKCPIIVKTDKLEKKVDTLQIIYGAGIFLIALLTLVIPFLLPKLFGQ